MGGPEERWVDIDGVADHLGVTTDSLYRWVKKRGFPVHRVGRLFRFKLSEVDAWVKSGQAAADPNPPDDKAK